MAGEVTQATKDSQQPAPTIGDMLLNRSESRQEALRHLSRSFDIGRKPVQAVLYMDKLLALQGGNERGATLFERVAPLDPEEPPVDHQHAKLYRRSKRTAGGWEPLASVEKLNNHAK